MTDWQPMSAAPRDGTPIQAEIPGHGSDNVIFWMTGLMTEDGQDCGGWAFSEGAPPTATEKAPQPKEEGHG